VTVLLYVLVVMVSFSRSPFRKVNNEFYFSDIMSLKGHYKEILKDMFAYGMVGISVQAANILLLPLLTRCLSVKQYGAVDLVTVTAALVSAFVAFGLPSGIMRFYHVRAELERNIMVTTLLFFVSSLSVIVLVLLYFLTPTLITHTVKNSAYIAYFRYGWLMAVLMAHLSVVQMVLRTDRKIVKYGITNLVYLFLNVGIAIYLVAIVKMGVEGVLLSSVIATSVALIVGLFFIKRCLISKVSFESCRDVFKYSVPRIPNIFTRWINTKGTRYIIVYYLSLKEVGVFSIGMLLAGGVSFAVSMFQNSWGPYIIRMIEHASFDKLNKRMLTLYVGCTTVIALLAMAMVRDVCIILLSRKYLVSLDLLPWLMGGLILYGTINITSVGSSVKNRTGITSIAGWSSAVVNVLLCMALIPYIGLLGAAMAFFCARLLIAILYIRNTFILYGLRFDCGVPLVMVSIYLISCQLILYLSFEPHLSYIRYVVAMFAIVSIVHMMEIKKQVHQLLRRAFNKCGLIISKDRV